MTLPPGGPTSGPPTSADGRFYWDGYRWIPVGSPVVAGPDPYLMAARKNPALHVLMSFFIPGLGTLAAGRTRRGATVMCLWAGGLVAYFTVFFVFFANAFHTVTPENLNDPNAIINNTSSTFNNVGTLFILVPIFILFEFAVWVFGMIDAHQSAQRWNAEHGIPY